METLRKSCSSLNRVTMPEVGDENAGCQSCNTLRKQTQHSTHSTSHSHCWGLFHICDWAHRGSACDRPANTQRKEKKHQSNVYAPYVCRWHLQRHCTLTFHFKNDYQWWRNTRSSGGRMNGWGDDKKTRGRWEESEKEEEEEEEERGRETSRRKQWTEERGACERVDR